MSSTALVWRRWFVALCFSAAIVIVAEECLAQEDFRIDQWSHDVEIVKRRVGISIGMFSSKKAVQIRKSLTYDQPGSRSLFPTGDDWYPDTASLISAGGGTEGFVDVGGGLFNSQWLDPASDLGASNDGIQRGDLIVLYRQEETSGSPEASKPLVMIYCGREPFPDLKGKDGKPHTYPFFIYPYYSCMEWNTFPPRQHKQLRLKLLNDAAWYEKLWRWIKNVFTNFSTDPDYGHRYVHDTARGCWWLKTGISENYHGLWHDDELWSKKSGAKKRQFKYRVFRLKPDPEFVRLKSYMPNHVQSLGYSSCFFAAYANIATYYGKNPYGRDDGLSLRFEKALINREVIAPNTPYRREMSRLFRHAMVYTEHQHPPGFPKKGNPWGNKSLENAPGNQLNRDLLNGDKDYLGFWFCFAYSNYKKENILEPLEPLGWSDNFAQQLAISGKPGTDGLWNLMQERLRKDEPIMVAMEYGELKDRDGLSWGCRYRSLLLPTDIEPGAPDLIGHFIVVVGLRSSGKERFVYFIEYGRSSCVTWDDFVASMHQASIGASYFDFPAGWTWQHEFPVGHPITPIVVPNKGNILDIK